MGAVHNCTAPVSLDPLRVDWPEVYLPPIDHDSPRLQLLPDAFCSVRAAAKLLRLVVLLFLSFFILSSSIVSSDRSVFRPFPGLSFLVPALCGHLFFQSSFVL